MMETRRLVQEFAKGILKSGGTRKLTLDFRWPTKQWFVVVATNLDKMNMLKCFCFHNIQQMNQHTAWKFTTLGSELLTYRRVLHIKG